MPNHMQETVPTVVAAVRNAVEAGAAVVWWTAVLAGLGVVTVIAHDDLNDDGDEWPDRVSGLSAPERPYADPAPAPDQGPAPRGRAGRPDKEEPMHRTDEGRPAGSPSPYTTIEPPPPEWPPCVCGGPVCPDRPSGPGEETGDER
ncbi:hypothetical protein [Streptomyces tsukubensis]|uniref:hypothetical protein n=1 Tax=Streptomyces tsukubensis TaxID=83656 RepID=UPI003450C90E